MKKILSIALVLCLAFTLFAACTPKTDDEAPPSTTNDLSNTTTTEPSSTPEEPNDDNTNDESPAALVDFAKTQNDIYKVASTDQYGISCEARGKSLVISYKYGVDAMTKEIAETTLNTVESTYSAVLSTIKAAGIDCESVILEFIGKDGNVLASKEYK